MSPGLPTPHTAWFGVALGEWKPGTSQSPDRGGRAFHQNALLPDQAVARQFCGKKGHIGRSNRGASEGFSKPGAITNVSQGIAVLSSYFRGKKAALGSNFPFFPIFFFHCAVLGTGADSRLVTGEEIGA